MGKCECGTSDTDVDKQGYGREGPRNRRNAKVAHEVPNRSMQAGWYDRGDAVKQGQGDFRAGEAIWAGGLHPGEGPFRERDLASHGVAELGVHTKVPVEVEDAPHLAVTLLTEFGLESVKIGSLRLLERTDQQEGLLVGQDVAADLLAEILLL